MLRNFQASFEDINERGLNMLVPHINHRTLSYSCDDGVVTVYIVVLYVVGSF